jgi:hypothetical protein
MTASPRPPLRAACVLALACLAAAPSARAAADDVNAAPVDAPDAGSRVVAFGRRVLETVLASERSVVDAISANVGSPSVGVSRGPATPLGSRPATLAARAAAGAQAAADPTQRDPAYPDFSLGARWRVLRGDADSHVPCVSWMADVQPVSAAALAGGNSLRPSMHLSAEWALSPDLTFGLMPGIALDADREGRRLASGSIAVTLGKEWAPGVRTFVDMARDRLAIEQGGGNSTTLDAGVTVMTGPSTQVDFALARGLTSSAPALQAGVGVSSTF